VTGPLLRHPINALVSYHFYAKQDVHTLAQRSGLRLIGDSGAYSALSQGAPIDLRAFAEWGARWRNDLCWLASLDVIGDARGSRRNYEWLRSQGLNVIPTVHYGAKPTVIDAYVKDGVDFIGLGGMVSQSYSSAQLLRWALSVMRYARHQHPQVRFHGWGVTTVDLMIALPWWSVDSSSYGSAWRYGRQRLFDPRSATFVSIGTDGRDAHRHADFLSRYYSVTSHSLATVDRDSRPLHGAVAAKSYQYVEDYVRKRFPMTPPTYGITGAEQGQSVHLVDGAERHLSMLKATALQPA
jgi:hypothetical protein